MKIKEIIWKEDRYSHGHGYVDKIHLFSLGWDASRPKGEKGNADKLYSLNTSIPGCEKRFCVSSFEEGRELAKKILREHVERLVESDDRENAEYKEIEDYYPNFPQGFRKAKKIRDSIKSFDDIELHLMKGQGLAKNSYKTYMVAVRQLYEYTGCLNPFQVTSAHIEGFYDIMLEICSLSSCYHKVQGLKRFFNSIKSLYPGYITPFEIMPEMLIKKLNKTEEKESKTPLFNDEQTIYLNWLKELAKSGKEKNHYSIVFFLITSGLRAEEFCSLNWNNIHYLGEKCGASFTGKNGNHREVELYSPAVKEIRQSFKGKSNDFIFCSPADHSKRMKPHALWFQVERVGKKAKEAGIMKREEIIFSPELFRRTFAYNLHKGGMSLKAIASKLGNKSIDSLGKHYIDDNESIKSYFDGIFLDL